MTLQQVILVSGLIGGVVLMDVVLVSLLLRMGWQRLSQGFGHEPPAPDAVRRNFQTFRVGAFNLGLAIHVAVDDRHLHLLPSALLRWVGARPVSVPWSEIHLLREGRHFARAKIGHASVIGPSWCLTLAEPTRGSDEG